MGCSNCTEFGCTGLDGLREMITAGEENVRARLMSPAKGETRGNESRATGCLILWNNRLRPHRVIAVRAKVDVG